MTELIREQLAAVGLMICSGLAAGVVYEFFYRLRHRLAKCFGSDTHGGTGKHFLPGLLSGSLQIVSLVLIGYSTSVFFYVSSYGKITFQGTVCFFIGLLLWRKLLFTEDAEREDGKEGEQTPGIREE